MSPEKRHKGTENKPKDGHSREKIALYLINAYIMRGCRPK
jgi:hypothetical protein